MLTLEELENFRNALDSGDDERILKVGAIMLRAAYQDVSDDPKELFDDALRFYSNRSDALL